MESSISGDLAEHSIESVRERAKLSEQIEGLRRSFDLHIEDDKHAWERIANIERIAAQIRAIVAMAALLGGGAALIARWSIETVAEKAAERVIERQINKDRGYP